MALNSRVPVSCAECAAPLMRRPLRPSDWRPIANFYCDNQCKGRWQQRQKPVDEQWLRQKYLIEGLSAPDIAKIVSRNSKQVWRWLRGYGIETRPRGHVDALLFKKGDHRPVEGHHHRKTFKGHPHTEKTRRILSAHKLGKKIEYKAGHAAWTGVTGSAHPTWRGGRTPERQAFYGSKEWKSACVVIWHRADARCERCHKDSRLIDRAVDRFHIHHIVSFQVRELRAVPSNLALLCYDCHRFVHSAANINREFLEQKCLSYA